MQASDKIFIAGRKGLVGSALDRVLTKQGFTNIIGPSHKELDLTDTKSVTAYFVKEKPDYIFLAAAKVGGIHANDTYPADFIRDNLIIQNNVIESSYQVKAKKLLFLGSSCIYPKLATQPMDESQLLTGKLEPTNEPYAVAKIAGIIMCQSYNRQYQTNYISVMPTNLYGLNDNYHPENSHVIPGLIRRFHEARVEKKESVVIWGSGKPFREFLYSDDLAAACVFLMKNYSENEMVNIGSGQEVSIKELAQLVKETVGYQGKLEFDTSKADGTPRKLLDVSKLNALGWQSETTLGEGLKVSYRDFLEKNS